MTDQTPTPLSVQAAELAERVQSHLDRHQRGASVLLDDVSELLTEVAGKLRSIALIIDTAHGDSVNFMAAASPQEVVDAVNSPDVSEATMVGARSIIDQALEEGDAAVVGIVRNNHPMETQEMLVWYLLQSLTAQRLYGDPNGESEARKLVGAHCTECGEDWDLDGIPKARQHSRDLNHHIIPTTVVSE